MDVELHPTVEFILYNDQHNQEGSCTCWFRHRMSKSKFDTRQFHYLHIICQNCHIPERRDVIMIAYHPGI